MTHQPFSGYLPKKFESIYLQIYMDPYVDCSIIHGGQDMETIEVSFARWFNKEDMVHICSGILLSHKKRWNSAICDNMNGFWEYHAKWKGQKEKEPYDFNHMWDIKLKATSEQTRETNKQKLISINNSMMGTRGKGVGWK